jgi:hypothetical protein
MKLLWKILLTLLGLVVVGAVVAVVLLKTEPGVYTRTFSQGADPKDLSAFDDQVVNQVANVFLDKSRRTPLELHLTEAAVNARLIQTLADVEASGKPLPPAVRDLRVAFEPGQVVLVTRVGSGPTAAVVTQPLNLAVGPEGRLIVKPGDTTVGLVPVPMDVLSRARPVVARQIERLRTAGDDSGMIEILEAVQQALSEEPVPLGKGKKRIVLERLTVDRGTLQVVGHQAGRDMTSVAPEESSPPQEPGPTPEPKK